jgi:hypothetical protein
MTHVTPMHEEFGVKERVGVCVYVRGEGGGEGGV